MQNNKFLFPLFAEGDTYTLDINEAMALIGQPGIRDDEILDNNDLNIT